MQRFFYCCSITVVPHFSPLLSPASLSPHPHSHSQSAPCCMCPCVFHTGPLTCPFHILCKMKEILLSEEGFSEPSVCSTWYTVSSSQRPCWPPYQMGAPPLWFLCTARRIAAHAVSAVNILSCRHLKNSKCRERLSLNFPCLPKDRSSKRNSIIINPLPSSFTNQGRWTHHWSRD